MTSVPVPPGPLVRSTVPAGINPSPDLRDGATGTATM